MAAAQITDFLKQIQGLSSYSNADLEDLLYECRFQLLPPLNNSGRGGDEKRLPLYRDVPEPEVLHDMLISGAVPGGHQCMAHALYPDSVPWPSSAEGHHPPDPGSGTSRRAKGAVASGSGSDVGGGEDEVEQHRRLQSHEATQQVQQQQASQPQQQQQQPQQPSGQPARKSQPSPRSGRPLTAEGAPSPRSGRPLTAEGAGGRISPQLQQQPQPQPQQASVRQSLQTDNTAAGVRSTNGSDRGSNVAGSLPDAGLAEVTLCGRKVNSTVRGKSVQGLSEDLLGGHRNNDDERYNAARDKRIKLERTLQLEQYQEHKLSERIQNLEDMRASELDNQERIKKREARRVARSRELKRQLEEGWQRKLEEERTTAEEEAEKKAKEEETEKRWEAYHEKQRSALEQWYSEQSEDGAFSEEKVRQKREDLWAKQVAHWREKEQARLRTVKRLEAEDRIVRTHEATEERPPLPPRPHDRPPAVLEAVEEAAASRGRPPAAPSRPRPTSRVVQAKVVSNMYGLSEKEASCIETNLFRSVKGSGRMANYES